jgi:hypothetical protein
MSAIYFPLRASVELFTDPQSPAALTRVKEAAVLYDRLYVEGGLYDTTFTESGESFNFWTPGDRLTPERLQATRQPVRVGEPMTIVMGKQDRRSKPAETGHVVMQGPVATQFVAHFDDAIEELRRLNVGWMEEVTFGPNDNPFPLDHPIGEAIRERNFEAFRESYDLPGVDPGLRRWVYTSFNRDSVIAASLGAAFNVSPLFRPVLERGGVRPDLAGGEALSIVVPNLGALPWEAVAEFRDHPGSEDARARLREFEGRAAAQEPEDAYRFLKQVSREVNAGYVAAVREYAPRLTDELRLELMKTLVSVSTVVGPYIEKVASLAQAAGEARRFQRSWIAALMTLQPRS